MNILKYDNGSYGFKSDKSLKIIAIKALIGRYINTIATKFILKI